MSSDKRKILVVDDSAEDIHFLLENLKHDYAVIAATNGEKALEMASGEASPDVILMDVEMPGMNGYETCRLIKNTDATRNIDVIFVSAHDSTEEKLAGYDAGASDYLIKPVSPAELLNKVKLAIKNREIQSALEAEKKMAMETALTAMSSTGELGVILEFLRTSFTVKDLGALATLVIETLQKYSLECSLQIRSSIRSINLSSQGPISPLEQELLTRLKDQGRIMERGARLILNFGAISMLIKNMPLDDPDRCGRIRDNVAILLEGVEAKLHEIEIEYHDDMLKQKLKQLVAESNDALQHIAQLQQDHKETSVRIMDELMRDLEGSFFKMGLTEEQEEILLNITRSGVEQALENQDKGTDADAQLHKITRNLQQFCG